MSGEEEQHSRDDQIAQIGDVVNTLQESIGNVSNNLLIAYQKMAENMENSMKMMSNMNRMIESFILQSVDIFPRISRSSNSHMVGNFVVKNRSRFCLNDARIIVKQSSDKGVECEESVVFLVNDAKVSLFESEPFQLQPAEEHSIAIEMEVKGNLSLTVTLELRSPGSEEMISKNSYNQVFFLQ